MNENSYYGQRPDWAGTTTAFANQTAPPTAYPPADRWQSTFPTPANHWAPPEPTHTWGQQYAAPDGPVFPGYAHTQMPLPKRPSARWGLVVPAMLMSGVLIAAVAAYFAVQVDRRWKAGDVAGAVKASRLAKIWSIVGISLGGFVLLVYLFALGFSRWDVPGLGGPAVAAAPVTPASSQVASTGVPSSVLDPTLEEPVGLDRGQQYFFDEMSSELRQAVDLVSRGKDPSMSCIGVLVTADGHATGFEAAAQKATELCGREIPIAWAGGQLDVAAAESDRFDRSIECVNAKVTLDAVEKRFTDPRVDELRTRYASVCS